jgi:hypothetical protein
MSAAPGPEDAWDENDGATMDGDIMMTKASHEHKQNHHGTMKRAVRVESMA